MAQNLSSYRKVVSEFISIYRNEPCLWQTKHKFYHNRDKKEVALNKLLTKIKEIDPDSNRDTVSKKINSLRTSYNKERHKVNASKEASGGIYALYEPKLWYYKKLSFLSDQNVLKDSDSNIDDDDDEDEIIYECQKIEQDDSEDDHDSQSNEQSDNDMHTPGDITPKPTLKRNTETIFATDVLDDPINVHFKRPKGTERMEDRHDIFGKSIACKLRDLPKRQRILTEKLINDVMFEAEWGNLTLDYKVMNTCPGNRQGSFSS